MSNAPKLVTRDAHGRPLRWRDQEGVLHAVEKNPKAESVNVASWWTSCGSWNIAYSDAWGSHEVPTCMVCRLMEQGI